MTSAPGMLYGYARVSTKDQDLAIQKERLRQFGCTVIREEKASGTAAKRQARVELDTLLTFLRPGDTLVVQRIDRLARSLKDLLTIVEGLAAKGVALKATDQEVDTATSAGKAFLSMLGVFAQFETEIRYERQMEGVAKAKLEGVYKGRKPTISKDRVWALHSQGEDVRKIAKTLGISRASAYRIAQKNPDRAAVEGGAAQVPETPPQTAQIPLDVPSLFD